MKLNTKQLKIILLTFLGILIIITCKSVITQQQKNKIEKTYNQEQQLTAFKKILTFKNISFDIKTSGEAWSIRELLIQPKGLQVSNQRIVLETDPVDNAEIEDLDSDGFPEILIYTTCAGSGSYGHVIGYSVNNGKFIDKIDLADLHENKEAFMGYRGHDTFYLKGTSLYRSFPIYKEKDSNCCPTGGIREIQYKLISGKICKKFVIDKIK